MIVQFLHFDGAVAELASRQHRAVVGEVRIQAWLANELRVDFIAKWTLTESDKAVQMRHRDERSKNNFEPVLCAGAYVVGPG